MEITSDLAERFWSKVDKTDTCWNWTGNKQHQGYGVMRNGIDRSGRIAAHRLSYMLHYGPIEAGLLVDHICHNKSCVNPNHLRSATAKQNNENRAGSQINSASGVRGVFWEAKRSKWRATLCHNGKTIQVGRFEDLDDAVKAVKAARRDVFTHSEIDRR